MLISYIFPTRSRPEKLFRCLENIRDLSASDNYEIILTLDLDDSLCNNQSVIERLALFPQVKPFYGFSNSKVHAINRELDKATGDLIFCHSDDMIWIKQGFDDIIRKEFEGFSGLLHLPDGYQKRTCTYSIMDREYFDRFGYIYHESYISVYCDNEAQDVAQKLGRYKFIDKQILEHRHFCYGHGEKDQLLMQTESNVVYAQDRATYEERKKKNFDL